jgi:NADPH:quinone reductase-like Zn-dependent oxidoreductase
MQMQAAIVRRAGERPVISTFAEPVVAEGREMMTVVAAGLHPIVRQMAAGAHYASSGFPMIPGVDAVARTADGRLVYTGFAQHPYGTFAERVATPMGLPLPDGADPRQVAAAMNPGLSSWLPLSAERTRVGELGTVLVLGATGVAGRLAVANALALGASHVLAAGRAVERIADLATDAVQVVSLDELPDAIERRRPALVLDFLWGAPAELVFAALLRYGVDEDQHPVRYIEIGQTAGATAAVPAALLRSAAITICGAGAGSTPLATILEQLPVFMDLVASGVARVPVRAVTLDDLPAAWDDAQAGVRTVVTF